MFLASKNYFNQREFTFLGSCMTLRKHVHVIYWNINFYGCKNDNFQMKNCDIFLIFAQNIDRGYTLEPPQ